MHGIYLVVGVVANTRTMDVSIIWMAAVAFGAKRTSTGR